jgi:hypothetical protein
MSPATPRRYWYRTEHWECPLCLHAEVVRFRVYRKAEAGIYYRDRYDYCDVLYLWLARQTTTQVAIDKWEPATRHP